MSICPSLLADTRPLAFRTLDLSSSLHILLPSSFLHILLLQPLSTLLFTTFNFLHSLLLVYGPVFDTLFAALQNYVYFPRNSTDPNLYKTSSTFSTVPTFFTPSKTQTTTARLYISLGFLPALFAQASAP
jgi:hypothetical protein